MKESFYFKIKIRSGLQVDFYEASNDSRFIFKYFDLICGLIRFVIGSATA